jgi:hypothetical protein
MDDFATHIDGRAKGFQRDFYNVNGTHHTGAKAARLQQQYPLLAGGRLGVISV